MRSALSSTYRSAEKEQNNQGIATLLARFNPEGLQRLHLFPDLRQSCKAVEGEQFIFGLQNSNSKALKYKIKFILDLIRLFTLVSYHNTNLIRFYNEVYSITHLTLLQLSLFVRSSRQVDAVETFALG